MFFIFNTSLCCTVRFSRRAILCVRMMMKQSLFMLFAVTLVRGQRPFFAGSKPIGYPEVHATTDGLGDRFGESDGTTQRLPLEANGDRELVDRLSKLPIDKQPFWFINWQALEAHRQNPQTYPQKPNEFIHNPQNHESFNTGSPPANTVVTNPSPSSGNTANSDAIKIPVPVSPGSVTAQNSSEANVSTTTRNSFPSINSNNVASANLHNRNVANSSPNRNTVSSPSTDNSAGLGDRFGGIELNTYKPENDPIHLSVVNSYFKPGNSNSKNFT